MATRPMTKYLYALLSTLPDVIETGLSLTNRYFSVLLYCNNYSYNKSTSLFLFTYHIPVCLFYSQKYYGIKLFGALKSM